MNILILMAGATKDFEEKGYSYPKYLLEIQNKPIIQRIIESLVNVGNNITFIIKQEDQDKYYLADTLKILCPKCKIKEIMGETKGALCSALFAIDEINNEDELLILNGDQLIKFDISIAINDFRSKKLDAGMIVMQALHPKYSTVVLDELGLVVQTSEKRPISNLASTGCSYFKKGSDFVKAGFAVIEKDVNTQGNYYISSTFNEMILKQQKIGIYEIPKKDYISFSSYQMYENYITRKNG
ncbi:glycosyltransferase family 2 protein [bacterium]|nr:glycosyltransferase family 2 protein [bacterium]